MGQEDSESNGVLGDLQESTKAVKNCATKLVYSRDFLLSLAEQENCRQLPEGIDSSLLRDHSSESMDGAIAIPAASSKSLIRGNRDNDAYSASPPDMPEWRKPSSLPGSSFVQQGLRQPEPNNISSGRSGPLQGDNASSRNVERPGSNRWEPRVNRGDKERERSRPRREEDSTESGGRLHAVGLARSGVVSQEHDGLLGSGGPIVQRGVPQMRTQDRHQVSGRTGRMGRTTEQYQPTRGGKFSRREDSDSVNDETFGSDEQSNEERIEQERQRRDLFEQMRKEQRNKTKDIPKKPGDNWIWDGEQNNEPLLSSSPGTPHSSSSKDDTVKAHSRPVTTPSTPRLLVPPGFSKVPLQKTNSLKESDETFKSTLRNTEDEIVQAVKQTNLGKEKEENALYPSDDVLPPRVSSISSHWLPIQGEHLMESSIQQANQSCITTTKTGTIESIWSGQTKYHAEGSDDVEISARLSHLPGSIETIDNLFAKNNSVAIPGLTEALGLVKLSSVEDKSNPVSYEMPIKSQGPVLPMPDGPSLEDVERMMTATAHTNSIPRSKDISAENERKITGDQLFSGGFSILTNIQKQFSNDLPPARMPPVFLTCEDLEQSFLAQTVSLNDNGNHFSSGVVQQDAAISTQKGSLRENAEWNIPQVFAAGDNGTENASQHILSLLQRSNGKIPETKNPGSGVPTESTNDERLEGLKSMETLSRKAEVISLESLFGKTFANELRSVGEPVSSKVAEDSVYASRGNGLQSLLGMMSSNKQGPSVDAGIRGKQSMGGISEREKKQKGSLEPDVHKVKWSDKIPHERIHMDNLVMDQSTVRAPMNGPLLGEVEERTLSANAHQGHFHHQAHYEGPFATNVQHAKPLAPMHEAVSRDVGIVHQNSSFHLQGNFFHPNHHIQGQGLDGVGNIFKIPSLRPESVQSGFELNHHMQGRTGLSINPQWFASDPSQNSQGFQGFHPYQYPVPDRNDPDYGRFGQHLHGNLHILNSTVDKLSTPEIRQFPYAPGFDGFVASSSRKPSNG